MFAFSSSMIVMTIDKQSKHERCWLQTINNLLSDIVQENRASKLMIVQSTNKSSSVTVETYR
jgi:hypothetical protein